MASSQQTWPEKKSSGHQPYEDDHVEGGSGRSGRKAPRTKATRPSRGKKLISPTPVAVRGKRLLTPPTAGGSVSGGGSRGRPRSTRAAAAKANAKAAAAKATAEASAARAVEAAARAAEADAAAAAAVEAAAATGRAREDADDSSSDAGQRDEGQQRAEKRFKTEHRAADSDAAADGSSAYGRHRFSFPSSIAAPGNATPRAVAQVAPSPRKEAAFAKTPWSSMGNSAAQGQPAASGEMGMKGAVGGYVGDHGLSGGASAMPVTVTEAPVPGGGNGFVSR